MPLRHGAPSIQDARTTGRFLYGLLTNVDWTVRRVETVRFLDYARLERRVTLDLDPADLARRAIAAGIGPRRLGRRRPPGTVAVPLMRLKKQLVLDLDLVGQESRSLHVMSSDQDSHAACSVLLAVLEDDGYRISSIPESVVWTMYSVVRAHDSRELDRLMGALGNASQEKDQLALSSEDRNAWMQILESDVFFQTLLDFSESYLLMADVPALDGADPIIVKIRHVEEADHATRHLSAVSSLDRFGLTAQRVRVAATGIGTAQREHTRVIAPEGSSIHRGRLMVDGQRVAEDTYESRETFERMVVYTSNRGPSRYSIDVSIEPSLGSFFVPAALITGFMSIVLLLATWLQLVDNRFSDKPLGGVFEMVRLGSGTFDLEGASRGDLDAAVTILALVPSLLAVYFARAGEHQMVSRLLITPRLLVVGAAAATIFAGAATAAGVQPQNLLVAYWVAFSLSAVAFLLTGFASLRIYVGRIAVRWRRGRERVGIAP